jgi:hypothetical protein
MYKDLLVDEKKDQLTLVKSFTIMLNEMNVMAKQHEQIAENLQKKATEKIDGFLSYFKHNRIDCMNHYRNSLREYLISEEALKKPKLKYERELKKSKELFNRQKQLKLLDEERNEYKYHVDHANLSMKKFFEDQLPSILNNFQKLEDQRVGALKDILYDSIEIEMEALNRIKDSLVKTKNAADNMSSEKDNQLIAELFKTGNKIPKYHVLEDLIKLDETTSASVTKSHSFESVGSNENLTSLPSQIVVIHKEIQLLKKLKDSTDPGVQKSKIEKELNNLNQQLVKFEKELNDFNEVEVEDIDTAVAMYNFKAMNSMQTDLLENETLKIAVKDNGNGWTNVKRMDGIRGLVPTSYLKIEKPKIVPPYKDKYNDLYANVENDRPLPPKSLPLPPPPPPPPPLKRTPLPETPNKNIPLPPKFPSTINNISSILSSESRNFNQLYANVIEDFPPKNLTLPPQIKSPPLNIISIEPQIPDTDASNSISSSLSSQIQNFNLKKLKKATQN